MDGCKPVYFVKSVLLYPIVTDSDFNVFQLKHV